VSDRVPYNEAIASSWKDQTLLNIVKMRYVDTPFFVDVAAVTSGYSKSNSGNANASVSAALSPELSWRDRFGAMLGVQTAFEDRPTISYSPQTGAAFVRNLSSPIAPKSILYLIESGYDAEIVLELLVDSINGLNNSIIRSDQRQDADPRFHAFLKLLKRAQQSGNFGMRIEDDKAKGEVVVVFFRDKNITPEQAADVAEARKLLGLKADQSEFKVVFGAVPKSDSEIAVMSRSVYRILHILSLTVEVPACHLADGRAPDLGMQVVPQTSGLAGDGSMEAPRAGFAADGGAAATIAPTRSMPSKMVIHSSLKKPCDSFAAVSYRGYWFWVDDRDPVSKRYFHFLMGILAQADTSAKDALPLVTIRAN